MKKILKIALAVIVFPIIFLSCSYAPDGAFTNPANQDVLPPEIQVVSLNIDADTDTLYLYNYKTVVFEFASSDNESQNIARVHFSINGILDSDVTSQKGEFALEWGRMPEGAYELKLDLYTHSGTHSIADQLGAEQYWFTKSWVVIVNSSYYVQTHSQVTDGYLDVVWPEYKNSDRIEYVIYRGIDFYSKREIGRTTSCHFIDSSYVGEGLSYFVNVNIEGEEQLQWGALHLNHEMPDLSLVSMADNRNALVWNRSKYYSAIESSILTMADYWYLDYHPVTSFSSPNDTVFVLADSLFGFKPYFQLEIVPRIKTVDYYSGNRENYISRKELQIGHSFAGNNRHVSMLSQVDGDQFVFGVDCDSIYRYSLSQKRISDQLGFSYKTCIGCSFNAITRSSSGNYMTNYTPCERDVILIDAHDFLSYRIQDLKQYTENYSFSIPISDNGKGIANTAYSGFYVYDFNVKKAIAHYYPESGSGIGLKISKEGDYFLVDDSYYKLVQYNDSTFETIVNLPRFPELPYFEFDAIDPERVYYWDGAIFYVKNCSNFSTISQFVLKDEIIKSVDPYNKRLLTYKGDMLYIRDLTSGEIEQQIPTYKNPNMWWDNCRLIDNALVSSLGIIYFLKQ